MKKTLTAIAFVLIAATTSAQINKGQWLIGGDAGFESAKVGDLDEAKYTSFMLNPNAGHFFINNFAGGLRVNLQSTKFKEDDGATTGFSIMPFLRYYFLPAVQRVNLFADAGYGFGSTNAGGERESVNQYAISAGPAIFLSPNTALEFTLQYRSVGGAAFGGDDRMNNFGVNIGFQVHLGNAKK
jgi:hypothetical protein